METAKRVRIGNLYLPSGFESPMDEIIKRITRDPSFVETHRDRMTPQLKASLIEALQEMLGPSVKHIKLTFSLRAGCSCPCSPGFAVSGVITEQWSGNPFLTPALCGFPNRERAVFYLNETGVLEGRTREQFWEPGRGRARRDYRQKDVMSMKLRPVTTEEKEGTVES